MESVSRRQIEVLVVITNKSPQQNQITSTKCNWLESKRVIPPTVI